MEQVLSKINILLRGKSEMNEILKRIGEIGIVPVLKVESPQVAVEVGKALIAGDVPIVEVALRTQAAFDAIGSLASQLPELLVGAGTVLTEEQVKMAVGAGSRFIVSPGYNPKVVGYCVEHGITVIPGFSSASEIEMALERKLEVLKFFPAESAGGLGFLKSVAAPFGTVRFLPTGGIDASNQVKYMSYDRVHAVAGTWICPEATVLAGNYEEITRRAQEAVVAGLGFKLEHLGINETSEGRALSCAEELFRLFGFLVKDGARSVFAGSGFEIMKLPSLGKNGHICISTLNIQRAISYLGRKGIATKQETAKVKAGVMFAIYIDLELSGFAIHLLQA